VKFVILLFPVEVVDFRTVWHFAVQYGMVRMAYMNYRIEEHAVVNTASDTDTVEITVDGKKIPAKKGEPILAALLASGIRINRYTAKKHEPRGLFCGIGQCTDCVMIVNGRPNVRTCITPVESGMIIKTQNGIEKEV
jgi:hypothetical protein